jgi:hypothetical protein
MSVGIGSFRRFPDTCWHNFSAVNKELGVTILMSLPLLFDGSTSHLLHSKKHSFFLTPLIDQKVKNCPLPLLCAGYLAHIYFLKYSIKKLLPELSSNTMQRFIFTFNL